MTIQAKTANIQVPEECQENYDVLVGKLKLDAESGIIMPLFIRDLWIEALLSGRYTQGRGHLLMNANKGRGDEPVKPASCCLGVLGLEVGLTPLGGVVNASGGTILMHGNNTASSHAYLDDGFALMLGLTSLTQHAFALANDDYRLSFPLIAKAIEEAL